MSNYGSNQVGFILVDGYDVTGAPITSLTDDVEAIGENNHGYGDSWFKSAFVGVSKFTLALKGFFNDVAGGLDAAFNGSGIGALRIIAYNVEGNTVGKHFSGFQGAAESSYKRMPGVATLHKAEIGFASGGGAYEQGQITHPLGAETAAGDTKSTPADANVDTAITAIPITSNSLANPSIVTTPVPHGLATNDVVMISGVATSSPTINGQQVVTVISPTTFSVPVNVATPGTGGSLIRLNSNNGGSAYIEVPALTLGGYTNVAPLMLHSSDNVTYSTLATFAPLTAAPNAQRVVVAAGTLIKRYLANSWTLTGSGSGLSVRFFSGFARG